MGKKHVFLYSMPIIGLALLLVLVSKNLKGFEQFSSSVKVPQGEYEVASVSSEGENASRVDFSQKLQSGNEEEIIDTQTEATKDAPSFPGKSLPTDIVTDQPVRQEASKGYSVHKNITSTVFWIGEDASDDNKGISNMPSAWDEAWVKHYGGIDEPSVREGFFPKGFMPRENPFYVALPYNDFNEDGERKANMFIATHWMQKPLSDNQSALKNRWVRIMKNGKAAYAQWEDVGPFGENDAAYVFGSEKPKSKTNNHTGIDVSPAIRDYFQLQDVDTVDWQFVDEEQVPNGPWKKVITTSNIYWK